MKADSDPDVHKDTTNLPVFEVVIKINLFQQNKNCPFV